MHNGAQTSKELRCHIVPLDSDEVEQLIAQAGQGALNLQVRFRVLAISLSLVQKRDLNRLIQQTQDALSSLETLEATDGHRLPYRCGQA